MPISLTETVLPGVYVENVTIGGTPLLASKPFAVLLVGLSNGQTNFVYDPPETVTKGALDSQDALAQDYPDDILWVSDVVGGYNGIYRDGTDFQLTNIGTADINGWVNWSLATRIDVPVMGTPVVSDGTAGLAAGTYYYTMVASRRRDNATTYVDTSLATEVNGVITSATGGAINLLWSSIVGAERYKIYRSQTSGSYGTSSLVTTITSSGTDSYVDSGGALSSGYPSATNDTRRAPYVGQDYFCAYEYKTFDYLNATEYTKLSGLHTDHEKTSELGIAGTLAMGANGTGQEAPLVVAIGLQTNDDTNQVLAMTEAESVEDYPVLIAPITTSLETQRKWKAHVISMNDVRQGKHRLLFAGPPFNTTYGNSSTVGTIIYNAESLSDRLVAYCAPGFIYSDVVQDDNTTVETALDGSYLAAAVAGRISALGDAAEPGTYKPIYGIKRFATGTSEASNYFDMTDKTIKKLMLSSGVLIVEQDRGNFRIMQAVTTSTAYEERYHLNIVTADLWLNRRIKVSLDDSGIIGKKNISTVRKAIKENVRGVLEGLVASTTIINYGDIEVEQHANRRDWVVVRFSYRPVYPISVIYVAYIYDLSI